MNAGGAERGYVETLADWTLAFPRVLWHKRSVEILTENPDFKINIAAKTSYLRTFEEFSDQYAWVLPVALLCSPIGAVFYAAIAVLIAAPFLGVGLVLKKTALCFDEKAQAYSDYAQSLLEQKVLKEEEEAVTQDKDRLNTYMLNTYSGNVKENPVVPGPRFIAISEKCRYVSLNKESMQNVLKAKITKIDEELSLAQANSAAIENDVAAKKAAFEKFYN